MYLNKITKKHSNFTYALYVVAFTTLILSLILLSSEVFSSSNPENGFCKKYDWGKVEGLVEPYLDDSSFTSLVMQGISSEYNTSEAASQAMLSKLPKEIYNVLSRIVKLNCP